MSERRKAIGEKVRRVALKVQVSQLIESKHVGQTGFRIHVPRVVGFGEMDDLVARMMDAAEGWHKEYFEREE